MLPGGLSVLGVFIITDSNVNDVLTPLQQVSNSDVYKTDYNWWNVARIYKDCHTGLGEGKASV